MKRVVLASASPRRRELLAQVGVTFEVLPSEEEETCAEEEPAKLVEALSCQKAESVAKRLTGDFIVIGADTVVAKDGRILGKPRDEAQAFEMLALLQGSVHQVYSGVTLFARQGNEEYRETFHVCTAVEVLAMTREQITTYIQTGECMDKAGAYGIQGRFAAYIKGIEGDYYAVVGLPLSRLMQSLQKLL